VSAVQGLLSLQSRAAPAVQAPAWHVSAPLHTLPSLHEMPFASAVCWHPFTGSQVSVVHGLLSLQLRAVPAVHTPAWHVSAPLHAFPSLQEVPLRSAVCWHPAIGSQVSVVQKLLSLQSRGVPATHTPAWHVSAPLQRLPSLHEVPFASVVCWHPVTGSQVSVVHGLLSLQLSGVPAVQVPAWHVSTPLHVFPSLHEVPFASAVLWQPVSGSHVSAVHGLLSLQLSAVPAVQMPA
jgi:ABC-type glucose/galactose transport system permease subunit